MSSPKKSKHSKEEAKAKLDAANEDMSKFWPVFRRDNQQNKNYSFWQKKEKIYFDDSDEPIMEGVLSRIGKKNKQVKNYYYKLYGDILAYYGNSTDSNYKGYLKLDKNVGLERKSLKGKKEYFHYLEFYKDSYMRKLYTNSL